MNEMQVIPQVLYFQTRRPPTRICYEIWLSYFDEMEYVLIWLSDCIPVCYYYILSCMLACIWGSHPHRVKTHPTYNITVAGTYGAVGNLGCHVDILRSLYSCLVVHSLLRTLWFLFNFFCLISNVLYSLVVILMNLIWHILDMKQIFVWLRDWERGKEECFSFDRSWLRNSDHDPCT